MRHQEQEHRKDEDERADGATPAVGVRSGDQPDAVSNEEQGNQEPCPAARRMPVRE